MSLERRLNGFAADLRILAKSEAAGRFVAGDEAAFPDLLRAFETFAGEKPYVAQIRFIDEDGMERARVDRIAGRVRATPIPALQNKKDRYYVRDALELPHGGLYISPLDLNVERGAVESPWRPMLRMATPLRPFGAATPGLIVLNIDASELLSALADARPGTAAGFQLLNTEGYWLAGVSKDHLWGFMLGRDARMAAAAPEAWSAISASDHGAETVAGETYVFRTVRPALAVASTRDRGGALPDDAMETSRPAPVVRAGDAAWKIAAAAPAVPLIAAWSAKDAAIAGVGMIVNALVCLSWAGAMAARREAERKKQFAESELIRNVRLASLGRLVAGVAHELNTPLGNAVTIASTMSENVRSFRFDADAGQIRRSTLDRFLVETSDAAALMLRVLERANELIGHFKQVAVDQTSERRRRFRLDDFIRDVAASVGPQFKASPVELDIRELAPVMLDSFPGGLGQVLMNLINNALVHGYGEGEAGRIVVMARAATRRAVEISVRDDGAGISAEKLPHIFEPFFTTRLGAGGSGLGLSIVHNIVTGLLGGSIHAESGVGVGTTIRIILPMTAPSSAGDVANSEDAYHVEKRAA